MTYDLWGIYLLTISTRDFIRYWVNYFITENKYLIYALVRYNFFSIPIGGSSQASKRKG